MTLAPATAKEVTRPVATTEPALRITGLHKAFGGRTVLEGFDLVVRPGEVVALLGANGSGKSTALKCVVGLQPADGGDIVVSGTSLVTATAAEVRRARTTIALVSQQVNLVRRRTALDNICAGALGRLPLRRSFTTAVFPRELREEAMACLDRVGLSDRAHDRVGSLSGGQQQRVALARALCQRASVLLADEPVSALDPSAAEQVMTVMAELAHEEGLAVAAVLHQPDLALRHADRVVGLRGGRIAFSACSTAVEGTDISSLYLADTPRDPS